MGGRWFVQIWVFFVLTAGLAACGDNLRNDGPFDASIDASDATDATDATDAPPDAPIDAACSSGATPMYCSPNGCTDLAIDPLNCGACGTTCANGASCLAGVCCDAGESNCSGTCVDFQDDEMNCGACGTMCSGTQTCTNGMCRDNCSGSTPDNCGTAPGVCTNVQTDNDNCGACGTVCDTGETCSNGACVCDTPDTCNNGTTCTNFDTDPANCGGCGIACPLNQVCNNGQCATTCLAPTTNCSGSCADTQNDPFNCGACGMECDAGEVCNAGTCTSTCASPTPTDCNGSCSNTQTDPMHCGNCTTACPVGAACTTGACVCPGAAPDTCDGFCVDMQTDEANCGSCNNACASGDSCIAGECRIACPASAPNNCGTAPGLCTNTTTDPVNCGACGITCTGGQVCSGGTCGCPLGTMLCGGQCVNVATNDTHCGACNNACDSASESCTAGVCLTDCAEPEPNRCGTPGTCHDFDTDELACGNCTTECLIAGQSCTNGQCACDAPTTLCAGQCVNTTGNFDHCGGCNMPCTAGQLCSAGQCVADCDPAGPNPNVCNNACTNTQTDEANCGSCNTICPIGATCTAGGCVCPVGQEPCNGECVDTDLNSDHCGACGNACLGGTPLCTNGTCCGFGETGCNGECVDLLTDASNCGACGDGDPAPSANECTGGSTCNGGVCACPFGTEQCGSQCIQTDTDPLNCGGCTSDANPEGEVCPAGEACVSGGCVATCPAPLEKCNGNQCVNKGDDNNHCGNCGNQCPTGQGCSDGACVPMVVLQPPPAGKCVGGGPPIVVPTSGGNGQCTGNLGAVSFNFGLCSCTNIGPLSQPVTTDAFNSSYGPYIPSCATDADCGAQRCVAGGTLCSTTAQCNTLIPGDTCAFPVECRLGQCVGGGVGVNNTISDTADMRIGGDFWVFGDGGMDMKGDITVGLEMQIKGALSIAKLLTVNEDAYVGGPIVAAGGQTDAEIGGTDQATLWRTGTSTCAGLPGILMDETCMQAPLFTHREPCACDPAPSDDLIDVRFITEYFSDPTRNDNLSIGLDQTILTAPSGPQRLDLPCGYYYLDSIGGSQPITIMVTGRTALFVGGSIRPTQELYIDLQPGSTLDVFVGGVMTTSQTFYIGNPSYPRLSRVYLGGGSCAGSGTCARDSDADADCCSGVCNSGTCNAMGGALSQALQLSGSSYLNGVFYAGHGTVRISNPLEMYGAIFAKYYEASGPTIIHYDEGITAVGAECPPPSICDSCRDCNNQACVNGTCGACTADTDCCSPFTCNNGTCQ